MAFTSVMESPSEWLDTDAVSVAVPMPEPDEDYAYVAARLFSWFPVVNSKGATYFPEDFDSGLLDTLKGKQANLEHNRKRIVGTIQDYLVNDEGVDVVVQIDRRCADLQNLDLSDLQNGQFFSHVSVELTRSLGDCFYYSIDEGYNVQQKIPVKTGNSMGMRRTTNADPYMFQGNRVIERIKPARFTGVGLVPNPADTTAQVYALAASDDAPETELPTMKNPDQGINVYANDHVDMSRDALTPGGNYADPGWQEDGKKRYPLDDPDHVRSAAKFFGEESNAAKYSPEHRAEIHSKIAAAEKKYGIGDQAKKNESASAEIPLQENKMTEAEIKELQDKAALAETASADLATAKSELETVKEELASATGKVTTLQAELDSMKEAEKARETAAALDAFVELAHAAKPFANDEERAALREEAASYIADDARKSHVLTVRENENLKAKVAALETAAAAPATETPATETPSTEETASDPEFKAHTPGTPVAPTFAGGKTDKKELNALY